MNKITAPSVLPELFSDKKDLDYNKLKQGPYAALYNVCFIGHVDAGKSTTVARILFDTGRVAPHIIQQYEQEAKAMNKESFKFAWLMDKTKAQRQRGITIDVAHAEWSTDSRYYTIIDAPGHTDFIKNMITGTSQADLAVLVVDAKKGVTAELEDYKNSNSTRTTGTSDEHMFLARSCGISSLIVALNKVNLIPLDSRMKVIEERKQEILELAMKCGFNPKNIMFVPINSWDGWNIIKPEPTQLPGYDGPTLIDALDKIPLDHPDPSLPLRMSIQSVFPKIGGTNIVVAGKVISGLVYPGQTVSIKPANVVGTVRSIQMHHKNLGYATAGANIGIDLKGVTIENCTKASIISDAKENTAKSVDSFVLENAVIRYHPTELTVGSNVIIHYQTGNVCCEIKRLYDVKDMNTKTFTPGDTNSVKPGSVVNMELVTSKPIVIEPKSLHPKNCRVMIRDCNMTIGFGTVVSVKYNKNQL